MRKIIYRNNLVITDHAIHRYRERIEFGDWTKIEKEILDSIRKIGIQELQNARLTDRGIWKLVLKNSKGQDFKLFIENDYEKEQSIIFTISEDFHE